MSYQPKRHRADGGYIPRLANQAQAAAAGKAVTVSGMAAGVADVSTTGADPDLIGIAVNNPRAANDELGVQAYGIALALAHSTINVGDKVTSYTDGTLQTTTTTGNYYLGIALTGAAAGGFFELLLAPGYHP